MKLKAINLDKLDVSIKHLILWTAILYVEIILLISYFLFTSSEPTKLRYLFYPFVWINTSLWAVYKIPSPNYKNKKMRVLAIFISLFYFLVLMYIPGLIQFFPSGQTGFYFSLAPPGWGPVIAYTGKVISFTFIPFEVIGYASLSYLIYISILKLTRGSIAGVLGLVSCVGCTAPVFASLLGFLSGGTASALTSTAYTLSYDLGTIIFVITLGLLYVTCK